MLRSPIGIALALLTLAPSATAGFWRREPAPDPQLAARVADALPPWRTDWFTLSRSGSHAAYSLRDGNAWAVRVVALADPEQRQTFNLGDLQGARVVALEWTSAEHLVVVLESGVIASLDVPQNSVRVLLTPRQFAYEQVSLPSGVGEGAPEEAALEIARELVPRWPQFLGVHPTRSDVVLVQGVAGTSLENSVSETAQLDVRSGKWEVIDTVPIRSPATRILHDTHGRARWIEDQAVLPLRVRVRRDAADRWFAWKRLDQIVEPGLSRSFQPARENLLDGRSFPLGFGGDHDVLYFANNVARETFAIAALNLRTGERTIWAFEDAGTDLAWPAFDAPIRTGLRDREMRERNPAAYFADARMPRRRSPLVFDRAGGQLVGLRGEPGAGDRWLDPVLADVQARTRAAFPGRQVRLIDWDDARRTFAVGVSSDGDPGRFFVYDHASNRYVEHVRRAPSLRGSRVPVRHILRVTLPSGEMLESRATLPAQPIASPPLVIAVFADQPWAPVGSEVTSRALAALGYAVVEIETSFTGRDRHRRLEVARTAPDGDAAARMAHTLHEAARSLGLTRPQAVAMGTGYGGWLALRAAELRPELIRAVVGFNAHDSLARLTVRLPERERLNPFTSAFGPAHEALAYVEAIKRDFEPQASEGDQTGAPLGHSRVRLQMQQLTPREQPPVHLNAELARRDLASALQEAARSSASLHAGKLAAPVLLVQDTADPLAPPGELRRLRRALEHAGRPARYVEIAASEWDRPLEERQATWEAVAAFLNDVLYRFEVDIGPVREVRQ